MTHAKLVTHPKLKPVEPFRALRLAFALAVGALGAMVALTPPALACGFGICGQEPAVFSPFANTPFMPSGYSYYYSAPMGQMAYMPQPSFDPVYVSNFLNWNGAQPLGLAVSPPLGGSAIFNDAVYSSMASGLAR